MLKNVCLSSSMSSDLRYLSSRYRFVRDWIDWRRCIGIAFCGKQSVFILGAFGATEIEADDGTEIIRQITYH